jgi:diguanylate cyclase (GGDEF)-like protein
MDGLPGDAVVDEDSKTFWSSLWSLLTAGLSLPMRWLSSWCRRSGGSWNRLSQENETFRSAINNLSQGVVLFDEQRRVVFCNARYAEIYRLSAEQIRPGTPISQLIQHRIQLGLKVSSAPSDYVRERLTGPVTASTVIQEFQDGRLVEYTAHPMPNDGGMATHQDITERERLSSELQRQHSLSLEQEQQLRLQNVRFDLAINNMTQGLCFFDGQQRLIVCNRRYLEIYDLAPESVRPGMLLREIIELRAQVGSHPDMTPDAYHRWRNSLVVSAVASETIAELKNGRVIKIRHTPMTDNGWVATHEDITDQKRAEEALAEQSRRFEAALHNMPHGLSMFNGEERLIVCNRRYAEMYRLPERLAAPGTTLAALTEFRANSGQGPLDPRSFEKNREVRTKSGEPNTYRVPLADGRTLQIDYEEMSGGGWVTTHQDITEATRAEAQINHLARHDALTGLPNRLVFRDELDKAMRRAADGKAVSVLCLDLDQFKAVNDTLGHPTGDELLRLVSQRLSECVRDTDLVARLGGDEFAVIQPDGEQPDAASALATRLIDALSMPYDIGEHHVVIGTSVGIATAPQDGSTADQILKNADLALYRAKSDGRGLYRFYESSMGAVMQDRRSLELDLRNALAQEEFYLCYQPLVSLSTHEVVGCEALLRWNHPRKGLIPPAEFIPIAEEIGIIVQLGAWVLEQACMAAVKWPGQIKVAVNLSPLQFKTNTLVLQVASALARSGLAAQRLELEITETLLLQDTEATLDILNKLQALGVSISLDDFGTGYSSLSYLRKFPFNKIKLDQSFVKGLSDDHESIAIVRAVTAMGRSLGMVTTAEGVETLHQLETLRAEACDELQGYYFSRPVPGEQLLDVIRTLNGSLKVA